MFSLRISYVSISSCSSRWMCESASARWRVSSLTLASRARVCQRGVALSVHLSSLERSHSAAPVAVRALCPPQCVALFPSLPLSSSPSSLLHSFHFLSFSHSCLLSCVHWLSSHSSEHVLFISHSPAHTRSRTRAPADTQDAHKYFIHADTLKWRYTENEVTQKLSPHCPMHV